MQRVWFRLSLLVLALFLQIGAAPIAQAALPSVVNLSFTSSVQRESPDRWSADGDLASPAGRVPAAPAGKGGATPGDANTLEQDSPLDDILDAELAAGATPAAQAAPRRAQRRTAGAGVAARRTALDAPFKPPRA